MPISLNNSTICALATGGGMSAIAVIRVSGKDAIELVDSVFKSKSGKKLKDQDGYTIHFGIIHYKGTLIDEVLISLFRNPKSYTGEDTLEISCHGSTFIQQSILSTLYEAGVQAAKPGEFTLRAFLNGKLDLSQAEAVADLIASENKSTHELALKQLRGGYSEKIKQLRNSLMNFAALIELELDFSTEDVEFADRTQLKVLVDHICLVIQNLLSSFSLGNAIKTGIPVTIAGKPNSGKSTLLNTLLQEDRAIVSEIAGTTRDTIEDEIVLKGYSFRFIDTAGLRATTDTIEHLGIERSYAKIKEADIVLYLFDARNDSPEEVRSQIKAIADIISEDKLLIPLGNKTDEISEEFWIEKYAGINSAIPISAKTGKGINLIEEALINHVQSLRQSDTLVTNARHAEALRKADISLKTVLQGLDHHIPGDLLSSDIRNALDSLSEITGEVTSDEVLGVIFGKFCIGK
ncbi:MAG: tRNA uridine-5-carboxymethylaminomethyl(34) synthesis GTPase MnmE [Bacteroidia bacterium]